MRTLTTLAATLGGVSLMAQVVINEVDYDQLSTDGAEYIEIVNVGTSDFPLQYLNVIMYNGSSGTAVEYRNIASPSWPALAPGDYFVICTDAGATTNCDFVAAPTTNLIQNGPNDAIALVMTVGPVPQVMDVVSYAGSLAGYVEGTGTEAEDSNDVPGISIGRFPDGQDTGDNNADFHLMCSTPGAANVIDPLVCDLSTSVPLTEIHASTFSVLPAAGALLVFDGNMAREPLTFEVFSAEGRLLASQNISGGTRASWTFDATALGTGLVLVRLATPTRQETRRAILP